LATRLRAQIDAVTEPRTPERAAVHAAAIADADAAVAALHDLFFATPYRPTGLSTADRAVIRLVDELRWLNGVVLQSSPRRHATDPGTHVCAVKRAAAEVLDEVADALITPGADCHRLGDAASRLRSALSELEQGTTMRLPGSDPGMSGGALAAAVGSALDPTFRAQELSFVVAQIARNTDYAAAAERRSWPDRLRGRQPQGLIGPLAAAHQRAGAHVQRHSIWLHNSVRGAAGLALAVLVADLSAVSHGFWVIFGTLSVLRSNALSTGQNVVRALLGTAAGFLVGAALILAIGTSSAVLWALLPVVILFAGLAPAAISFAAGQAAFTLTLLILFNILAPAGWRIGIVRIEDVALGGAVSLVVGLLFWPRGAAAALGTALADAYRSSVVYLSDAVSYGLGRCDSSSPATDAPGVSAARAAAASRRLDDAFRGYLADRGSKPTPLPEVTSLVTGVSGVRLAADAVLAVWHADQRDPGDRAAARAELLARMQAVSAWYDAFAVGLAASGSLPAPMAGDAGGDERLISAVARDLSDHEGQGTVTGVRVIWTGDHLDAVRRLQVSLVAPAQAAADERVL
ncbi:MAG: FUSC family protein, partial [Actinomycetota bacterium]|nr:FUSC family protein [Actinomycetota bacterium]